MKRRKFLKFAGFSALLGVAESFRLHRALAATWNKVGTGSGSAGTWQKLRRSAGPAYSVIGAGGYSTHAIKSDGLVYSSGFNTYGGLGDNTTTSRSTFVQAIGISNAVAVSSGYGHAMALRSDGLVFTCGYGSFGKLGDNQTTNRSTFAQAIGISNAAAVACGGTHSVALRADGLVFATSINNNGRLGDGTTISRSTFVQAVGISNAVAISGGEFHTVALRSDGLVYACGYNHKGQLGNNNSALTFTTYVQVVGISNAVAISAGNSHSVALRSDGLVFTTGDNSRGQLGDNIGTGSRSTYAQAIGISNAVAIAAGQNCTAALRSDGMVFGCGYNGYGNFGDGTNTSRSTFVQAVGISNAVAMSLKAQTTMALRSDGLVFIAGENFYGQLAANIVGFSHRSTFVQAIWP